MSNEYPYSCISEVRRGLADANIKRGAQQPESGTTLVI